MTAQRHSHILLLYTSTSGNHLCTCFCPTAAGLLKEAVGVVQKHRRCPAVRGGRDAAQRWMLFVRSCLLGVRSRMSDRQKLSTRSWTGIVSPHPAHSIRYSTSLLCCYASDALITREHGPVYVYIQFTVLLLWVNASAKWIYFSVVISILALFQAIFVVKEYVHNIRIAK